MRYYLLLFVFFMSSFSEITYSMEDDDDKIALDRIKEMINDANDKLTSKKDEIVTAQIELAEIKKDLEYKNEEKIKVLDELNELKTNINDRTNELINKNNQTRVKTEELNHINISIATGEKKLELLTKKLENIETEIDGKTDELNDKKIEVNRLSNRKEFIDQKKWDISNWTIASVTLNLYLLSHHYRWAYSKIISYL